MYNKMYNKLLNLEKGFFKLKYISDREWLEETLHEKFHECGKSGVIFDRNTTIASLHKCAEDRHIEIYNFECDEIADKCYLVHYITQNGGKRYYRTSVWVGENGLKLIYHQATLLNNNVEIY